MQTIPKLLLRRKKHLPSPCPPKKKFENQYEILSGKP